MNNPLSNLSRSPVCRIAAVLLAMLSMAAAAFAASETVDSGDLTRYRYKGGEEMLHAFAPIAISLRHSVAKLDVNGSTAAIATVIDTNGLALTKASEIKRGKLTSWTADGKEYKADLLASDEESDLALVRIHAPGLIPISWSTNEVTVGQWTVSPGTEEIPQAVGIVSVPTRRILPKRALIGVWIDMTNTVARITTVSKNGNAEKAGIKPGDIILAVNGGKIKDGAQLVETLRTFRDGQTIHVHLKRGEKELDLDVKMMAEQAMFGRRMGRQDYMNRMGSEISERAEGFASAIQHDTVIEAWFCGGPLVDLDKKVVGINIARAGRVATYALPSSFVREALTRLRTQAEKLENKSASN